METQQQIEQSNARIERLLNEREAADYMGLKDATLSIWRTTKRYPLPYILVGGAVRYRLSDIEKFLAARTVGENQKIPKGIDRRPGGAGRPSGKAWYGKPNSRSNAKRKTSTRPRKGAR